MDSLETALGLLPERIRSELRGFAAGDIEEIRLRAGKPPGLVFGGRETSLRCEALCSAEIARIIERATGASLHSSMHQLKEGYINYRGLRIGVCGRAVIRDGELSGFADFSSLAIRIPASFSGSADEMFSFISRPVFENTLIVSPPGGGKTTLLRELVRRLSDSGLRVAAADERGELSGESAEWGFELGVRTDVLCGVGKARAAMMLIRGMNPQIVALDEITSKEDAKLMTELSGCGVGIIATAHSGSAGELAKRDVYRLLLESCVFKKAIEISLSDSGRAYNCVRLIK